MYDILLSLQLSTDRLRASLANVLNAAVNDIKIIPASPDANKADGCKILCVVDFRRGDFPTYLSILKCHENSRTEKIIARNLCSLQSCYALISDNSINPYSWQLIDSQGNEANVLIAAKDLDEVDEFKILNPESITWYHPGRSIT